MELQDWRKEPRKNYSNEFKLRMVELTSQQELVAMQFAAAMKMTLYAGLIAALVNPFNPLTEPVACVLASFGLMLVVGLVVGCIESLTARLPMRWVTHYLSIASVAAIGCMVVIGALGVSN